MSSKGGCAAGNHAVLTYCAGDDGVDAGGDEGDEEEVEDEDTEGESDDPELDKFTAELDELEEVRPAYTTLLLVAAALCTL